MSRSAVLSALVELLRSEALDHELVMSALAGGSSAERPVDAELAALAAELRRLRWLESDATAMELLADAAREHASAVERHLAWLDGRSDAPRLIRLDGLGQDSGASLADAC